MSTQKINSRQLRRIVGNIIKEYRTPGANSLDYSNNSSASKLEHLVGALRGTLDQVELVTSELIDAYDSEDNNAIKSAGMKLDAKLSKLMDTANALNDASMDIWNS